MVSERTLAVALFDLFRLCSREAPNEMILTPEMIGARDVLDSHLGSGVTAVTIDRSKQEHREAVLKMLEAIDFCIKSGVNAHAAYEAAMDALAKESRATAEGPASHTEDSPR